MEKETITNMYRNTLTTDEQNVMQFCSVVCQEGLSVGTLYRLMGFDDPQYRNALVDGLVIRNWLYRDGYLLFCCQEIKEAINDVDLLADDVSQTLERLKDAITLLPLDDVSERRECFVAARLYLTFIMHNISHIAFLNNHLLDFFEGTVIEFCKHVELSYCNGRLRVFRFEERDDYALLNFVLGMKGGQTATAYRLLGTLYASIFRYKEAEGAFAKGVELGGENADMFLAQARMYENLGIIYKTFSLANKAFDTNKATGNVDANIEVALYIAYLCGVNSSIVNCKQWLRTARKLIGKRNVLKDHPSSIQMKFIEALIHLEEPALAFQILDDAELDIVRLYGSNAPAIATLSYIRSLVYGEDGQLRKATEEYGNYVDCNHYNYGPSVGDTAAWYSSAIVSNIARGNHTTANIISEKMTELHNDNDDIAPGVRFYESISNASASLLSKDYKSARAFCKKADGLCKMLYPDDHATSMIAHMFINSIVPKAILMSEERHALNVLRLSILLCEGKLAAARKFSERASMMTSDKHMWDIHLGRIYIKEGNHKAGLEIWENTISATDQAHRFSVCKEIAEWAMACDLIYEAMEYYERALQPDNMVYAKNSELAEALRCYGDTLTVCGLRVKSGEQWKQGEMLLRSMNDRDGLALLYFSWASITQDAEAERLLKKAIAYWKPENRGTDETLSYMFYYLAVNQGMQGHTEEARCSAKK